MLSAESTEFDFSSIVWVGELGKIKRYEGIDMTHRTDVFVHSRRVMYLARTLAVGLERLPNSTFKPDLRRVSILGYHHDDPEILTGDFIATVKRSMTPEQNKALERQEDAALFALAHFVFGLQPPLDQIYVEQQQELREKRTLESQIVDIADKWDALGEVLHDIRCGNQKFVDLLPFSKRTFEGFSKYPVFMFLKDHPSLEFDKIPTSEEARGLPTISVNNFQSFEDINRLLSSEGTDQWPALYRTWAVISRLIFYRGTEKFLFPGWYLDLWRKFDTYNSPTTVSGLWLPLNPPSR